MSYNNGPKIVTNGLVLYLDAGTTKSYPGSGTTWTDLSGNNNNGTLINGPTYSSANKGGIVFDGINDYVNCGPSYSIINNFCYDIWCLPQATHQIDTESTSGTAGTSGQRYLIGPENISGGAGSGISIGTNGVSVYEHSSFYLPPLLVYQISISSIINIVINYVNKRPSLYLNGIFIKNGLTSPRASVTLGTNFIGYSYTYGYFSGRLYNAKFYNRVLSDNEILQNYNATKGRYNL